MVKWWVNLGGWWLYRRPITDYTRIEPYTQMVEFWKWEHKFYFRKKWWC